jgi:nucleotide-binding universal stress UspA family protein
MYKRILVPLDETRSAEAVLEHVARLAEGTPAAVTVLSVLPLPEAIGETHVVGAEVRTSAGQFANMPLQQPHYIREGEHRGEAIERARTERADYLSHHAVALRDRGIETHHEVVFGEDPAEAITDIAREGSFDLIAMATHGREGLSRLLSGSVAGKVLERTALPVLLVRGE